MFGGLVGAITWNLITWYFGLPSSSSHALIGGMVGAVLVAEGPSAISFDEGILGKVMIPAIVAPILAFVVARRVDPRPLPDRGAPAAAAR